MPTLKEDAAMQHRKRIVLLSCLTLIGTALLGSHDAHADEGCRAWLSLCDNGLQCCSQICASDLEGVFRCAKTGGAE